MQKAERRPKWAKPKLIVLVRGRSEEVVLQSCKINGDAGPGGADCWQWEGEIGPCWVDYLS